MTPVFRLQQSRRIIWLGLTYPPAIGGAPRYTALMAQALDDLKLVDHSLFLVAHHPNEPDRIILANNVSEIRRIFSHRAAKEKKRLHSYGLFALDNLRMLDLPRLAQRHKTDTIVVHGWYMLNPSILWALLPIWKRLGFKLVADVRDCYLGESRLHRLDVFDRIICSGMKVKGLVTTREILKDRSVYVPVPMGNAFKDRCHETSILDKARLDKGRFIFSPNGVDDKKRFPLLYEAWRHLLDRGESFDLVIAGRTRDWRKQYEIPLEGGRIVRLGSLSQPELAQLYSHCAIAVNVSNNESFGRVPIEALELDIPMLFPSGVPEFAHFPKVHLAANSPIDVADQISRIVSSGSSFNNYDLSQHRTQVIAELTIEAIYG